MFCCPNADRLSGHKTTIKYCRQWKLPKFSSPLNLYHVQFYQFFLRHGSFPLVIAVQHCRFVFSFEREEKNANIFFTANRSTTTRKKIIWGGEGRIRGSRFTAARRFEWCRKIALQFSFPREEYPLGGEAHRGCPRGKNNQVPSVLSGHVIGRKRQKYAPIDQPSDQLYGSARYAGQVLWLIFAIL